MENFPVKMQNANGLISEALHVLFATCPTCRWRFHTMSSWGNFPNTWHNKKGTATLLPPTCSGGDNSSILYHDKQKYFEWSNKERKWFRGFEPQYQKFTFIHANICKETGPKTLPANWAESAPSQNTPGDYLSTLTWVSHGDTAHVQLQNVIILQHKDHKTAEFFNDESELNQHGYH